MRMVFVPSPLLFGVNDYQRVVGCCKSSDTHKRSLSLPRKSWVSWYSTLVDALSQVICSRAACAQWKIRFTQRLYLFRRFELDSCCKARPVLTSVAVWREWTHTKDFNIMLNSTFDIYLGHSGKVLRDAMYRRRLLWGSQSVFNFRRRMRVRCNGPQQRCIQDRTNFRSWNMCGGTNARLQGMLRKYGERRCRRNAYSEQYTSMHHTYP